MTYRVAIVGIGPDPDTHVRGGVATAYRHAAAYHRLDSCELVACADVDRENAESFADTFGVSNVYRDHETLLRAEPVDVVSVCTPPGTHAELVAACASTGTVAAVHCEVPVATTWGDCREMVAICDRAGVQLSFDHQHRFARPVTAAGRLLEDGTIGELRHVEWSGPNLFSAGTHRFDLCEYFSGESPPQWALAGVDTDPDNRWYGALNDVMGVAHWEYRNGVQGFASTAEGKRETLVDAYLRLVGWDGVIEIGPEDGPPLRVRKDGRWRAVETDGESIYGRERSWYGETIDRIAGTVLGQSRLGPRTQYDRAIEHVVSSLSAGTEPLVSGRRTLRSTELIYACWESARRRGRVDLPLDVQGNPLEALCFEKYGPPDSRREPASGPGTRSTGRSNSRE